VEMLAQIILELEGYTVEKTRHVLSVEGRPVAEIDVVAKKDGETYYVEVKSGKVSVTDVRQAYTNARLAGVKPLIVARGFSDDAARITAKELGVEVLLIPDYLHLISPEEILQIVEAAVHLTLEKLLPNPVNELSQEELQVVRAIALSNTFEEAANKLGIGTHELGRKVSELREKGAITSTSPYRLLRLQCKLLLLAQ
jgi:predicted RecB family endonuclease